MFRRENAQPPIPEKNSTALISLFVQTQSRNIVKALTTVVEFLANLQYKGTNNPYATTQ